MKPRDIEWQWDETARCGEFEAAGRRYVFTAGGGGADARIEGFDPAGKRLSSLTIEDREADSAAFAAHGDLIYAALYQRTATGARVMAVDARTGDRVWDTRLRGLGSVGHSKYSNRVQMRIVDDRLVVLGDEASGRYVEVLAPEDGRLIDNRKVGR